MPFAASPAPVQKSQDELRRIDLTLMVLGDAVVTVAVF
jgi:hypothetical protein